MIIKWKLNDLRRKAMERIICGCSSEITREDAETIVQLVDEKLEIMSEEDLIAGYVCRDERLEAEIDELKKRLQWYQKTH